MQVDTESLQVRIDNLEMLKRHEIISLSGEYQLEAYKMLLKLLLQQQCKQEWFKGRGSERCCADCGKGLPKHD